MSKLTVRYVDPAKLRDSAHNAKTHPKEQVEQLVALIKRFGFTQPILVDEKGEIIAGHGRRQAALALKLKQVPVITIAGLTPKKKRALMLADNRVAMNGEWDDEQLAKELRDLRSDFDLEELGFSETDLRRHLDKRGDADAGDAPEYKETYAIIIDCTTEKQQVKLLERFGKEGLKCKALVS